VTSQRNWSNWIIYMLKAVEETSRYTIRKIEEIDRLFIRTKEVINSGNPAIRKEFIEKLFEQPYISPKKMLDSNMKSLNTAKKYLIQLEGMGILISKKIGKEIVYLNVDLFNILSES
jgi:Fic family protein